MPVTDTYIEKDSSINEEIDKLRINQPHLYPEKMLLL